MKKRTKTSSGPHRSEDQDTLTISLPKELKDSIKAESEKDGRSVSNFMVKKLREMLEAERARTAAEDATRH